MPKPPVIYTRLVSATTAGQSVYGVNATATGSPAYSAFKFGQGVTCTNAAYLSWTNGVTSWTKFSVDIWFQPAYASNDGTLHEFVYATPDGLFDWFHNTANLIECQVYSPGPTYSPSVTYKFTPTAWASGDIIHLQFRGDASAAAGSKMALYQNGSALSISAYTEGGGGIWTDTTITPHLGNVRTTTAGIANFKWFDYLVLNPGTYRENERAYLNDQIII